MTRSLLLSFVVVALVGCSAKDGKDGATGPAGATGPQGATGVMGPTGPAGPTGPQGPMGTPGTPGAAGAPGAPGAAGQSGVVSMSAIAPNAATLPVATGTAFFGATVNVTTTAAQKVTGVITATGAEATGSTGIEVRFSLCARTQGATTAPVRFAASGPVLNTNLTELSSSFSAAESKVLGAGMWEVGLCAENMGADPVSGVTSGWVMVTN